MSRARVLRVRVLRSFAGPHGAFEPGRVYEIEASLARAWAEQGLVEETAVIDPSEVETTDADRPKRARSAKRGARKSRRG